MSKLKAFNRIGEMFCDDWSGEEEEGIDFINNILKEENCAPYHGFQHKEGKDD